VLGLILAVTFVIVHVALPRMPSIRRLSSGVIRVSARLPLEPKKNLYVVRVGADYYLVGASESGLHYLTALDKDRIEAALEAETPPEREFSTLMQAFRRRKNS
jgi:flagellar biogenesis protein FliO